jgi:hypothetical protein
VPLLPCVSTDGGFYLKSVRAIPQYKLIVCRSQTDSMRSSNPGLCQRLGRADYDDFIPFSSGRIVLLLVGVCGKGMPSSTDSTPLHAKICVFRT